MDYKINKEQYMEEGNTVREVVRRGMKVGGKRVHGSKESEERAKGG